MSSSYEQYLPNEMATRPSTGTFHMSPYIEERLTEAPYSRPSTAITTLSGEHKPGFSVTETLTSQVYTKKRPTTAASPTQKAPKTKGKDKEPKPQGLSFHPPFLTITHPISNFLLTLLH